MRSSIHAVLLAGVHQWRPSVFERWVPRTLVPILNRPLVDYPLSWLRRAAIPGVSVCANSDTHILRNRFSGSSPTDIDVSFYEDVMPRGPAGCVADAISHLNHETIVVVDATLIPDAIDLDAAIQAHARSGAVMTVVASVVESASSRKETLSPIGIYLLSRSVLTHIPATGYQDIKEMLIPKLHGANITVGVHRVSQPVIRVTGAASCFAATGWLLSRNRASSDIPGGMIRKDASFVHEMARVGDGVRMLGPVWIGPGAEVASNVTIVGPTSIGAGALVAESSHVCRSILWDGAYVGASAVVDRCIVTSSAGVTAGSHVSHRIYHRTIRQAAGRIRSHA